MNSLRVSHLTCHDHTGAGRAAARLCLGLRQAGIDSRMSVHEKWTVSDWVNRPGSLLYEFRARIIGRLDRALTRSAARCQPGVFSHNRFSLWSFRWRELSDRDVVHLHWIGWSFLGIGDLPHIQQPVVWTIHDAWPFTGGCHLPAGCQRYTTGCGLCPQLNSTRHDDLSHQTWLRKAQAYRAKNITYVAPSRWMAETARSSALLGGAHIEVIPNAIDVERFRPANKQKARQALGLPVDARLILFGAIRAAEDHNKGRPVASCRQVPCRPEPRGETGGCGVRQQTASS